MHTQTQQGTTHSGTLTVTLLTQNTDEGEQRVTRVPTVLRTAVSQNMWFQVSRRRYLPVLPPFVRPSSLVFRYENSLVLY